MGYCNNRCLDTHTFTTLFPDLEVLECADMAKIYLIGGAPRVGKSTIMKQFIQQNPMCAISTDSVREVLKGVLSENDNPDLFKASLGPLHAPHHIRAMKEDPESLIPAYIRHFDTVWKSVEDLIKCNLNNEQDTVIEGTAILPKNVADLPYDHKVVFVTNLEDQTDIMLAHAQKHDHDWLSLHVEETIVAFANFAQSLNRYFYDQAVEYGVPVVQIRNASYSSDIAKATAVLLG